MTYSIKAALIAPGVVLFLNSCASAATPLAISTPSAAPPATVEAKQVSTAVASSTSAPSPIPLTESATPPETTVPDLACKLNWQSPANGAKFEPRTDFTVRWNVTNIGTAAWDPGIVDFVYAGGTRMYFDPVIPLAESVAPGETITLGVDMKALRNTSSYVTTWTLRRGDVYFCTLSAMIYVQWIGDTERSF